MSRDQLAFSRGEVNMAANIVKSQQQKMLEEHQRTNRKPGGFWLGPILARRVRRIGLEANGFAFGYV